MTFIIAEVGSNHGGDFHAAKEYILTCDTLGVDAVKFQAIPPMRNSWARRLKEIADDVGVELMVTPFDRKAVDEWDPYVKRWKIASAELVNEDLIRYVAETDKPLILSTGMATSEEVGLALDWTSRVISSFEERPTKYLRDVVVLHCVATYPTPYEWVNLNVLRQRLFSGLSDHSLGTHIPIAAVALGAQVIEKHLTLDRNQEGPDHHYALEPPEFAYMVRCIRDVEKALGDGIKRPMPGEAMQARGRRLESV